MVERVEGYCAEADWQRAYREINEFERAMADFGTVIVKFWIHIDRAEQLRRFRAREQMAHKQWKITDEDWRNRKKWRHYEAAVREMLKQTSTTYAPWTVVEANCKLHARIKALRTVADALEAGLKTGDSGDVVPRAREPLGEPVRAAMLSHGALGRVPRWIGRLHRIRLTRTRVNAGTVGVR